MEALGSRKKYLFVLITGLFMLGLTTWVAHEYRDYRHSVESTRGQVVEIIQEETQSGAKRDRAVIEFIDPDGITHHFDIPVQGMFFDYKTGELVTVIFDPDNPNDASVDGFWKTWSLIVISLIFAYGFFLLLGRIFANIARTSKVQA